MFAVARAGRISLTPGSGTKLGVLAAKPVNSEQEERATSPDDGERVKNTDCSRPKSSRVFLLWHDGGDTAVQASVLKNHFTGEEKSPEISRQSESEGV
jgi:hypothetical protein